MAIGLATVGACSSHSSAKPTTTSTPPAVSAPSAPVPDQAPDTSEDLTAPLTAKIGETFNVTGTDENDVLYRADVTVNSMKDLGSSLPANEFADAQKAEHGRLVVFTITYAQTLGAFPYNSSDWEVRMPDGQEYTGDAVIATSELHLGQDLTSGTLHKGDRAKGIITFDIPKTHGKLVYNLGLDQTAEVTF